MANKLELTWFGKDEPMHIEPRLLIENVELSNTAADPDTENVLIHGDNLLALKALEPMYTGQIKCIYIDPPFNTGQAFEHYDDNLEHSIWLNLMYERFKLLYRLLEANGMFWIHLDDVEVHYCKVVLDEIFSAGVLSARFSFSTGVVSVEMVSVFWFVVSFVILFSSIVILLIFYMINIIDNIPFFIKLCKKSPAFTGNGMNCTLKMYL